MVGMKILVLGGTAFAGRAIVEEALARGWAVATFNRGISGSDVPGVTALRGDRYDQAAVGALGATGRWDAVVDCSGFVPRNVLDVARALSPVVGRYVFVSTVSVYADWPVHPLTDESTVLECPPDAGPEFGTDTEDGPTRYGYQKSGCEAAAHLVFGDSAVSLRPGVVLGPREYIGRLPWWLGRAAAGGRFVAPGSPDRGIQPVDVRDLAAFALTCVEQQLSGTYNVTAPIGRDTFGDLVDACVTATGSNGEPVWVPDDDLLRHGVRQWSEMPLWRTFDGVWNVDSSRAAAAGLQCRPLGETVRDTWSWMQESGWTAADSRALEIGLSREREAELLSQLDRDSGPR
jgi:2'-hydroxyisoflavone reductase